MLLGLQRDGTGAGELCQGAKGWKAVPASSRAGAWTQAPAWMLIHHLPNYVPVVSQSKQRCQGVPTQPGLVSVSCTYLVTFERYLTKI